MPRVSDVMNQQRHYDPVIIFSFSKRECERNALAMSKLEFTDGLRFHPHLAADTERLRQTLRRS